MSDAKSGFIDEYNELRAEIRMYLEHDSKSLQIAMALGAGAVTFGKDHPLLLMVSAAIVSFLWFDEVRHLRAVQRTASYLEVFVEPNVPGLNWETTNQHNSFNKSWVSRAIAHAPYFLLIIVQAGYGSHLLKFSLWLGCAGIGLVSGSLFGFSIRTAMRGRAVEKARWEEIREKHPIDSKLPTAGIASIASGHATLPTSSADRGPDIPL
jgi:hypothetical protein